MGFVTMTDANQMLLLLTYDKKDVLTSTNTTGSDKAQCLFTDFL